MPVHSPAQSDSDGLKAYFTNVDDLRQAFAEVVTAPAPQKRLFVIHGVGGVGKTSLLRILRLHCKGVSVPVAIVSGDEVKSAVDVLNNWADDLKANNIKLPDFTKTSAHYHAVQIKVEQHARDSLGKAAGKVAVKTAEGAAGAVAGAAIGSIVPGIGTLAGAAVGAVIGTSGEALIDWLSSFLNKHDVDILLDPSKALTDAFLKDIADVASNKRLVLMLDTFEQMSSLDDWIRNLVQRFHPNVLVVIAGRAVPNWNRKWPGWLMQTDIRELKPMTKEVMRDLVNRYYATIRGGVPDPTQVEAIIAFARGLPIVVTSAVSLWVQYGVEDFQAVKPQVVADLVDRMLEGVPLEMIPALEAAAAVRWFNKDILRTLIGREDVDAIYNELRRFPFTRPRAEGLVLHDAVREIIDENLWVHDQERFKELHNRAARYFEVQYSKENSQESERFSLERLYHYIRTDEETGIQLFQNIAEELTRYRLVNRLRALLKDVNTYSLELKSSRQWLEYYSARLAHLEARVGEAEKVYQQIAEDEHAVSKLRAYALCDWGELLARYELIGQKHGVDRAKKVLEQSLAVGQLDFHLCKSYFSLARVARYEAQWDREKEFLEKARDFFIHQGDSYGVANAYSEMKPANARRGIWSEFFKVHDLSMIALSEIKTEPPSLKATVLKMWLWAWALAGRIFECERYAREALAITRRLQDDVTSIRLLRDLGWALGMQGKFDEAVKCFEESLHIAQSLGQLQKSEQGYTLGFWGAVLIKRGQFVPAIDFLNRSLKIKEKVHVVPGLHESLSWLGLALEMQNKWPEALRYYQRCMKLRWYGCYYYDCSALSGQARVKYAQKDYAAIPPLIAEAERLAQQYEYNDHFASLRLTQGNIAWDGHISKWGCGSEAALRLYQHALIYALRYNRFLLDEVLWGGGIPTPLLPIIPQCLAHNNDGKMMLSELRSWWETSVNDIGVARPDTISPISERISLLDAERIARAREPGDRSPQKTVTEHLDEALKKFDVIGAA